MLGKDLSEALSGIADDKIEAAANMTPVRYHRPTWARFAACAALVAVLIGVVYFAPGQPQVVPDPTGGTQVVVKPMFGIRVMAAEGFSDMEAADEEPMFVGEENSAADDSFGVPTDNKLRMYNAKTGEWELVYKDEGEKLPQVTFQVYWDKYQEKYNPHLTIYVNGQKMTGEKMKNTMMVGFLGYKDQGMVAWIITCTFEESALLEIVVEDKETGETLLKQAMQVTPAIYEKEVSVINPDGNSVTEVFVNEGYLLEVKEEYRIGME